MRFLFRHSHVAVLELDDTPVIVTEAWSSSRTPKFNTAPALEAVRTLSRMRDVFLCWRGHLVANPRWSNTGKWQIVDTPAQVSVCLHRAARLAAAPPGTPYDTLRPAKSAQEPDEQLRSCGLQPVYDPQELLGRQILAAAEGFPPVEGILSHPIIGEPAGRWLRPEWPGGPSLLRDVFWSSTLSQLFSAFELPPVDHAMLYTFLFGCFHAASLDTPRPILLVDSQHPGRGKGEIGQVLSVLLDGSQAAIPVLGRGSTDDLVAHLIEGHRVLAAQNVSGVADWNNEFFCCLGTDGSVKKRAKYDRYSTAFKGIVGMLSTVYGQASFHEDVISRAWRVYLHGPAQKLTPRPCELVVASREDLLREIRDVYAAATPYELPPVSRFAAFEAAGAGAYAAFTGLDHENVRELLQAGYLGARGLRTSAVVAAQKKWPEEFGVPVSPRILAKHRRADSDLEHARAFGRLIEP